MIKNVIVNLFSPPATRNFPATRRPVPEDYRGSLEWHHDACSYCSACALKCPTNAIEVDRTSHRLEFDLFKCVGCACCAEACKKGCIQMRAAYESPTAKRPMLVFQDEPVTEPSTSE